MVVTFEGKKVVLSQDPFIDGVMSERPFYKAHGTDQEGNDYIVTWNVVDHYESITDESEMCDWDNPTQLIKL